MWEPEFPTSLGVCTCNIYNGLTPASLRGDAAVSYGADACNTPNYVNTLLLTFALIAVYVLPLPELLYILPRWPVRVQSTPRPPHACTWAVLLVFDGYGDTIHLHYHTCSHTIHLRLYRQYTHDFSFLAPPSTHSRRVYCAGIAGYAVLTLCKVTASGKLKSNITTSTLLWAVAAAIMNFTW